MNSSLLTLIPLIIMETAAVAAPTVRFTFPGWKCRAFTMAYDDGCIHDLRMLEVMNRYGIKGTFYINAGPSRAGSSPYYLPLARMPEIYQGHEIGAHGYSHLHMTDLPPEEMAAEVVQDIAALEKITRAPIRCFAYPFSAYNDALITLLKKHKFVCARTTGDTLTYTNIWQEFLHWHPTAHHNHPQIMTKLAEFLKKDPFGGCLGLFTCWGHSYEFEKLQNWDRLEEICRAVAAQKEQLWLATNGDIFEYLQACQKIQSTLDGTVLRNPTNIPVYCYLNGNEQKILQPSSETIVADAGLPCPLNDTLLFPGGRPKALTFSYDDGSDTDAELVRLFNQYNVKGTFNVNSKRVADFSIYNGHEVASHSYSHSYYSLLPKSQALKDIYEDKALIEAQVRYPVRGYAYPCGHNPCYCASQVEMLHALDFDYARGTGVADDSFALPENWFNWSGNTRNINADFLDIADKFIETDRVPALLYVWGHSTELRQDWSPMINFLEKTARHPEIWYATNSEIHDYVEAARGLLWAQDKSFVYNPSALTVCYAFQGRKLYLHPGLTKIDNAPNP